jgi:replicative DNA helicase
MNSLMPSNINVELSLLSRILTFPEAELFEMEVSDFYRTSHQKLFTTLKDLWVKKASMDVGVVIKSLEAQYGADELNASSLVAEILGEPISTQPEESMHLLRQYSQLRQLVEVSNALEKRCGNATPNEVSEVIDFAQREILKVGEQDNTSDFKNISEIVVAAIDRAEALSKKRGVTGIPSGLRRLDDLLSGFQPEELYILAGRPSMGKTALAQTCMANSAKLGFTPGFFSLEMGEVSIINRFLSGESGVNSHKFRNGKFTPEDWSAIMAAGSAISNWKMVIDDDPIVSHIEICRKARKMKRLHGVNILWIDYLSFITGERGQSKANEVQTVTRALKAVSRDLKIPVVLLAQLNRLCETRPNKRPILSDLRDSGAIEQDADVVLFLYRHSRYIMPSDKHYADYENLAELNVAKNRNGPTGVIELYWSSRQTRFENLVGGV